MPFLADMDTEREALQSTAYPEVQTFCQKHGLMFEVTAAPPLTVSATQAGIRAPCSEGLHTRTTDESPLKKQVERSWPWALQPTQVVCQSTGSGCLATLLLGHATLKKKKRFTFFFFLAVLGLRCCTWAFSSCREQGLLFVAPNAGDPGSIAGQGIRPHMLQLRAHMPPLDLAQPNK